MRSAQSWARETGPGPRENLRCKSLDGQENHLEIVGRTAKGIIACAKAKRPVFIGGMEIPSESIFVFNGGVREEGSLEFYRDPRRDDDLSRIECSGPVELPFGRVVQPEAHLSLSKDFDTVTVKGGFIGEVDFSGIFVDGTGRITFDRDGEPLVYTLSRPIVVDGMTIPEGSLVHHRSSAFFGYRVSITLAGFAAHSRHNYKKDDIIWFVPRMKVAGYSPRLDLRNLVHAPNGGFSAQRLRRP